MSTTQNIATDNSVASRVRLAFRNPKVWQMAVAVVIMAVIAIAFFHPDAVDGNSLRQYDMQQGQAIGEETRLYQEQTGEKSWWTNSLFSGMPTFQISPTYPANSLFDWITKVYGLGLPSPSNLIFMMMFGFMILMMAMNVKWQYGLIGAVAWGFSTYFIIIIGAGHIWKFVTLSYIPPTIAGIIMAYRGRRLSGTALAALFAMMQIASNHIQMTYYFAFVMFALVIAFLVESMRKKEIRKWVISTACLLAGGVLAVSANLGSLYNTYEYSKETMRGNHSELTSSVAADPSNSTDGGLNRDYITQYSYGRAETFTLIIPDVKGGASAKPVKGQMTALSLSDLDQAEKMAQEGRLGDMERQFLQYMSQYFGEPESTNGPVYVGVIIFALFLVGCFVVKGPVKWALLVMTVLSLLLAMGRNCMWLTDMFIDYVPMYSKFRTVESILVIAEFTIPLLGILALQKLMTVENPREKYGKTVIWCFGVVAFFCLLGIFMPGVYGNVITPQDEETSRMIGQQLAAQGYPREVVAAFSIENPAIFNAVKTLRESMVETDSLRSIVFLLLAFIAIALYGMRKLPGIAVAPVIGLLVLVDLYTVNKRYVNHESFVSDTLAIADPFPMSAADRQILQDTAMNYRVMNIPEFMHAAPSYRHKSIGGYHAAKLTRYQDLIERHLFNIVAGQPSEADMQVLNMLNGKYIVDRGGNVILNDEALGNAWFVDKVTFVNNADEEMDALSVINPAVEAVADKRFKDILGNGAVKTPGDTIYETSYAPSKLTYRASTAKGGVAVFSEVYFPYGWKATVDGKPAELGRVDYILRALDIPAGTHTIELTFAPESIRVTSIIGVVAVILIYAMVVMAVINVLIHYRNKGVEDDEAV